MEDEEEAKFISFSSMENIDFFIHTAAAVVLGGREGGFFTTVLTKPCFDGTSEQKSRNFV